MKDTDHSWFAVFTQDSVVAAMFVFRCKYRDFPVQPNMDLNLKSFGKFLSNFLASIPFQLH